MYVNKRKVFQGHQNLNGVRVVIFLRFRKIIRNVSLLKNSMKKDFGGRNPRVTFGDNV